MTIAQDAFHQQESQSLHILDLLRRQYVNPAKDVEVNKCTFELPMGVDRESTPEGEEGGGAGKFPFQEEMND